MSKEKMPKGDNDADDKMYKGIIGKLKKQVKTSKKGK